MKKAKARAKVLVAMSGGVDSSVVAALLKQQGYYVAGAFMKNFSRERWEGVLDSDCPWEKDQADAQQVCARLGIPFRSFNFEKEYEKNIIDYFFSEYKSGRTPNPDVMCNRDIKFGLFLDKAISLGFDFVATGHYARIEPKTKNQRPKIAVYNLLKGVDAKKDQSYFLAQLNQKQLARSLFPLGTYTKKQVRALAQKFGLHNAGKKDSQGLCFIGHINVKKFLQQKIKPKKGMIIDVDGNILGQHDGVWTYTIGQRHGIGIGGGVPYYVVEKNVKTNTLVVAKGREDKNIYKKEVILEKIHWISGAPKLPMKCKAKIRYQQPDQSCAVCYSERSEESLAVKFTKPQFAVTSGQVCVLYQGDQILGSGIIEK